MAKLTLPFALLCLAGAVAYPLLDSNPADTTIAVFTLVFMAAGVGWNIFSGYTGYIALGHAVYFGLGSYTIALACQHWQIPGGWKPFLIVPLAGLVAAAFAVPLGAVALRTRRHTFIVITIAMFFIFQNLALNLHTVTGGSAGLTLPFPLWSGASYNLPFYYVILGVVVLAAATSWWVRSSKFGLELLAIRDDEDRARGLGVRSAPLKLSAFALSAFFVGMAGAVNAYFIGSLYPTSAFDALFDVTIALMAFLGGLGTLAGPILGALLIIPAKQELPIFTSQLGISTEVSGGLYLILLGVLFLAVVLLLPQGIVPSITTLLAKLRGSHSTPVAPTPVAPTPVAPTPVEPTATPSPVALETGEAHA
jgi:branched-chain amino acid transport system permease protein